jgi:hypothetical protein
MAGVDSKSKYGSDLSSDCQPDLWAAAAGVISPVSHHGNIHSRKSQQIVWVLVAGVGECCYGDRDHHLPHAQIPKEITSLAPTNPPPPPPTRSYRSGKHQL